MAATRANLTDVLDAGGVRAPRRARGPGPTGIEGHIAAEGLPWRVVSVGAKGCVAFTGRAGPQLPRLPRASTTAGASCTGCVQHNGGVFLPPWGKVEQWLLSVQHTDEDVDRLVANFGRLARVAGAEGAA